MDILNTINLSQTQASHAAVLDKARSLDMAAKAEKLDAKTLSRIDEAAKEYESVFLTEMMGHMFEGVSFDPMNGQDSGAQRVYKQFLVKEYANVFSREGGIGLQDSIRAQLIEIQASAVK